MQHNFIEKQNILPKLFERIFHNMQLSILLCRSLPFIVVTYASFYHTLLFEIVSAEEVFSAQILYLSERYLSARFKY